MQDNFINKPKMGMPRPNQKPELILPLTSFGMIDFGTIVPTSPMTVHVKGH